MLPFYVGYDKIDFFAMVFNFYLFWKFYSNQRMTGKNMPSLEPPMAIKPIRFIVLEGMTLENVSPLFTKKIEGDV